jgi:transposase-like protein
MQHTEGKSAMSLDLTKSDDAARLRSILLRAADALRVASQGVDQALAAVASHQACSSRSCPFHTTGSVDLMDPSVQFCPHSACRDKGRRGRGNSGVHSREERRYRCHTCGKTFAATTGTPFYRLHHAAEVLSVVVALLSLGCPLQAIVVACGLDERTVRAWWLRSGQHSAQVQTHLSSLLWR